jgi:hypothetical protein
MSVAYDRLPPLQQKGSKMTLNGYTYKVGDLFTTLKSKKTGVIKEIVPNASGSVRVLLEMPTKETRWTTISNEALLSR